MLGMVSHGYLPVPLGRMIISRLERWVSFFIDMKYFIVEVFIGWMWFWIYKIFAKTVDIFQELGFFLEFFENYITDLPKINQTRFLKNWNYFGDLLCFFSGISRNRTGVEMEKLWHFSGRKKNRKTRKKIFPIIRYFSPLSMSFFEKKT